MPKDMKSPYQPAGPPTAPGYDLIPCDIYLYNDSGRSKSECIRKKLDVELDVARKVKLSGGSCA
jgi:hypothetical protein